MLDFHIIAKQLLRLPSSEFGAIAQFSPKPRFTYVFSKLLDNITKNCNVMFLNKLNQIFRETMKGGRLTSSTLVD